MTVLTTEEKAIKDVLVGMLKGTLSPAITKNASGAVCYKTLFDYVNNHSGVSLATWHGTYIGERLGHISQCCFELGYPLISAIVVNKDGPNKDFPTDSGFSGINYIKDLMSTLSEGQRYKFMENQMKTVLKCSASTDWASL